MGEQTKFEEWAVLELFGHQRLAGLVSEVQIGGASFVRVDVPHEDKRKAGSSRRRTTHRRSTRLLR